MSKIFRKDLVLVNLGNVTDVVGHEQANARPCVVVQVLDAYGLAVIVPCTTKTSNLFHCVSLLAGTGGLPSDSFALCHQVRTISTRRIVKTYGQLPDREFFKILEVLSDYLDL